MPSVFIPFFLTFKGNNSCNSFNIYTLYRICNAFYFGLFGYVYAKLQPCEVEWVYVMCCKVEITLACIAQHVNSCIRVLLALDASK